MKPSLTITDTAEHQDEITLNDILDQMDLTDIYRTFHPKTSENTFFSSPYGIFSRINHKLGFKIVSIISRRLKSYQNLFP